jgi:acetyltransferase
MSIRNLDAIFQPKSIALIGASTREHAVGTVVAHNLLAGGFEGPVMPVNPHHDSVGGVLAYPDIAKLPLAPDLAVICTPAPTVPGLIAELASRGTRAAIVISAGFKELGDATGATLEQQMLDAARPQLLRIVGPNCLGVLSTPSSVNASFAHIAPARGGVAFVAQSGAMVTSVLDWASARGIGFSHLVSLGDMADVDFGDMLDFLANDAATSAILLYVEAVTAARKFMSAARAAARLKPVVVIKAGRHPAAAKAAQSHTGALAGADVVYDAAFRRAGLLRVQTLDALFDAVETLGMKPLPTGERLAILTNGGGAGVLATDSLLDRDGHLAELSPDTIAALDKDLPRTWSHANPVDIIGDAPPERYAAALSILLRAAEVDCVLVLNCPTAVASGEDAARAVIDTAAAARKTVLTNWLGADAAAKPRAMFGSAGLPTYETPDQAVRGYMDMVRYRRAQQLLMEVPASVSSEFMPRTEEAARIVAEALSEKRDWLDTVEIAALLGCYGIKAPRSVFAKSAAEAGDAARTFASAVALKIVSQDIVHKSDVGGVAVDLSGADAVVRAAESMLTRVRAARPKARIDGFLLQDFVRKPDGTELIAGMTVDPTFGPVLLFGHGGTAVEVIDDKALALAPINAMIARDTIARTRVVRELRGYRNRPPADLDAVALTLVKLSQLCCDLDEIVEMEINPLLADENGVIALDTRVRIAPAKGPHGARLAIKPYPRELESEIDLGPLGKALLRPVRPEDAPAFETLFAKLTPEDVRMRFFSPRRALPAVQLARLTQIDYDREMALLLVGAKSNDILGIVRLACDPDNERAEFAITVRSDLKHRGLGKLLMARLVDYARARRLSELFGDVLHDNVAMLALARSCGFTVAPQGPAPDTVRVTLSLKP